MPALEAEWITFQIASMMKTFWLIRTIDEVRGKGSKEELLVEESPLSHHRSHTLGIKAPERERFTFQNPN